MRTRVTASFVPHIVIMAIAFGVALTTLAFGWSVLVARPAPRPQASEVVRYCGKQPWQAGPVFLPCRDRRDMRIDV